MTMLSSPHLDSLPSQPPKDYFEGAEKKLEIEFIVDTSKPDGLRKVRRELWEAMLAECACTILSTISNEHYDAYLLSESSMFVSSFKLVIKTCGTTVLLNALPFVLKAAAEAGIELEWLAYSREKFKYPAVQKDMHKTFQTEVDHLDEFCQSNGLATGSAFLLGPLNEEHWVVYLVDIVTVDGTQRFDRTVDIKMFDLDADVQRIFYHKDGMTAREMTRQSGISGLLPGSTIDDFLFEPCGYSMNGLAADAFWTIHITPEAEFSYASFETNLRVPSWTALYQQVLAIFRPKRFTMTVVGDLGGMRALEDDPFDTPAGYTRRRVTNQTFEYDYQIGVGHYISDENAVV